MNFINILDNLHEEFAEYGKTEHDGFKGSFAIYKNPTKKEMMQIIKEEKATSFRLVADKKAKVVYLFSADMLHNEAIKYISGEENNSYSGKYARGYADLAGEIDEFYPDEEILRIKDWVLKNNALTWKALPNEVKRVMAKLAKEKKKQDEIDKKYKAMNKKKTTLKEVFVDFGKNTSYGSHNKTDFGIYKNPTSKEYREIMKEKNFKGFRILVDRKKKDYYLFNSELLHDDAELKVYGENKPSKRGGNFFKGFANRNGEIMFFRLMDPKIEQEVRKWVTKGSLNWPVEEGRG